MNDAMPTRTSGIRRRRQREVLDRSSRFGAPGAEAASIERDVSKTTYSSASSRSARSRPSSSTGCIAASAISTGTTASATASGTRARRDSAGIASTRRTRPSRRSSSANAISGTIAATANSPASGVRKTKSRRPSVTAAGAADAGVVAGVRGAARVRRTRWRQADARQHELEVPLRLGVVGSSATAICRLPTPPRNTWSRSSALWKRSPWPSERSATSIAAVERRERSGSSRERRQRLPGVAAQRLALRVERGRLAGPRAGVERDRAAVGDVVAEPEKGTGRSEW